MQDPQIQLWCEDEVHFQRHGSLLQMWAHKGCQPQILAPSCREKVAFMGALNLKSGRLVTQSTPTFSALTFRDFIHHLLRITRKHIYLILDNARWQHAQALQDFFTSHRERLTLLYLPAYSPELNPIERVWRITRRKATHNRYFSSLSDLYTALAAQFQQWQLPNSFLKVLCENI
jgi:transposase